MSTVTAVPLQPTKRSYLIYLWLGIALALIGAVALARQGDDPLTRNGRAKGVVTTASGLQYKILTPGKPGAAKPTDADVALVNYEGKLLNGTTFDKSQQPTPLPVTGVVPGFS
ncbi:MAG: FKBP-type peptidyl-prolyl cis-trans isomerase, partial [Sphingomonas sp.]